MFWNKKAKTKLPVTQANPFLVAWRGNEKGMIVNIDPNQIENAGVAGIMLADIYRHLARALSQSGIAKSQEHARAEMMSLFLAELQNVTDEGSGTIQPN